ncbi:predicted protein, partial [Nematostella vectensis]
DEVAFLPLCWYFFFFPYLAEERVEELHTDLPFFNCLMALQISSFVGAQHSIGRSLSAGGISGEFAGAGLLSSSWKCSIHLFFCPSSSAITPPFLSFTG